MSLTDILNSVEVVTEGDRQVVKLQWTAWQELVALLEQVAPAMEPAQTPLGRQLQAARAKIIAGGEPLLDWPDLEQEIIERRGGQV